MPELARANGRCARAVLIRRARVRLCVGFILALAMGLAWTGSAFAIPPNTPVVNVAAASYDVGGNALTASASHTLTSAGAPGNQAPTDIELDNTTVSAGTPAATVGVLSSVDPDAGDTHSYVVDDARFEIVGNELKLAPSEFLNAGETVTLLVTSTDAGGLSFAESFVISAALGSGGGASLGFAQYAPLLPGAPALALAPVQCLTAAGPQSLPAPQTHGATVPALPATLPLQPASVFKSDDALFLQVFDPDADLDPLAADQIEIQLATPSGDSERIVATETANNSGEFTGYIQSRRTPPLAVEDCVLTVGLNETVNARYVNAADASNIATAAALVDPLGLVFDSASGQPLDGVTVTLIDVATGQPAQVFADNGIDTYPATVVTGAVVSDGAGIQYPLPPGSFRFPFVGPGDYRLEITPGNRFSFPSVLADSALQLLPGGPYALGSGSRGGVFSVAVGPAVRIDVPLDVAPIVPTPSAVTLYSYSPGSAESAAVAVAPSRCLQGETLTDSPPAETLGGEILPLPALLELRPSDRFRRGDSVFIQVDDADQDLDPFVADRLLVTVNVVDETDTETVELQETGTSTGQFVGYLQTSSDASAPADCRLGSEPGASLRVSYQDVDDAGDSAQASALLDPGFTLFSSVNGAAISGLSVTLIDTATNQPAIGAVFAADGVSAFPATVTVGGQVEDALGNRVDFAPGSFYFPLIAPGNYRLRVDTESRYRYPSVVADSDLTALGGGPFVLTPGSRGATFAVTQSSVVGFDVPLDPLTGEVSVVKEVSKEVAAIGDFLQYRITVQNTLAGGPVSGTQLLDQLPVGLRYVPGSARFEQDAEIPVQLSENARALSVALDDLAPGQSQTLRYVVEVAAGTPLGNARNRVTLSGNALGAVNEAFADVLIRDDLLTSDTFILGRVSAGECDAQTANPGVADMRIYLEDGTYGVTDAEGKYHFEGVSPGTHVVQVDTATVPKGYELIACDADSRAAGQVYSRFVDVAAGSLWRADFYLRPLAPAGGDLTTRLKSVAADGLVSYELQVRAPAIALSKTKATVMLSPHLVLAPGSAKINGKPVADPEGVALGALTFRLPDTDQGIDVKITFDTLVTNASYELISKGVVTTNTAQGLRRAPVVSNKLSLDWPASLVEIARDRLKVAYPELSLQAPALPNSAADNAAADPAVVAVQDPVADKQAEKPLLLSAQVYEPSREGIHGDSGQAQVALTAAQVEADAGPYVIPEVDEGAAPTFDRAWLADQTPGFELVWPPVKHNPRIPSIAIAIKHAPGERPLLQIDGELVNSMAFEGTVSDTKRGVAVSYWDNVAISETDSVIRATSGADTTLSIERSVHFGGAPIAVEMVPELSYLIADGITPPVVAVRLRDRQGQEARPGITGEYSLENPYEPYNETRQLDQLRVGGREGQGLNRYRVRKDGVAYIQLEPTAITGDLVLHFDFDNLRRQSIRTRLKPGARDWILVGLVEGIVALNSRSGKDAIVDSDLQDSTLTDGRVAFYAKGMIKGQWLLTAAYDTDKETERRLREQIDPDRFYTLYGDGTEQRYDAESQRKLYLKLEKEHFSALFGDFDTGFDRTEYTRYARSMNGVQAQYYGDRFVLDGFASETSQSFVRESIPGDGTSGIYRLGRSRLVINSERVSIVTRDRFRPEEEVQRQSLVRYLDYSIDYDRGTLLFKQPVFSQDNEFNPTFIEVEYELEPSGAGDDLVAGTRAAYRLDEQDSEVALTYINDDSLGASGELYGIDLDWEVWAGTRIKAELANTSTEIGSGDAYLFEVEQQSARMAGEIYFRQQDGSFGLGQQSAFTSGLRAYGLTGEYRLDELWLLRAEAFQQEDLDTGGDRTVVSAEAEYRQNSRLYRGGLRSVSEQVATGSTRSAEQIIGGVSQRLLDNRLTLRGDAEVALSGGDDNSDYPSRVLLGADYDLFSNLTLIGEQEFTFSDERDSQDTRVGLKTRPWPGADFNTALQRELSEDGERVFATTGLVQQWRLNERWFFDFGADRVQTLNSSGDPVDPGLLSFRPQNPPASGSFNEDFSAFFSGVGYRRDQWDLSSRLEFHLGDVADKWNWLVGANRQLSEGKIVSLSLSMLNEELDAGGKQDSADLRVGVAWRPVNSNWLFLNRLDLNFSDFVNASFDTRSRKVVDNFHANYRPSARSQLSLQLGMKYNVENFEGQEYDGFTGLYGFEYRRDLSQRFDVGARASALQSFAAGTIRYSAGLSLGVTLLKNTWVSVGYNFTGFEDEDFAAAEFTAKGPYLKVRLKLDQDLIRRFTAPVAPENRLR
ncbi:MAG: hypothetical protein ACR2PZ_24815 [Pseudomonadales bacterium]